VIRAALWGRFGVEKAALREALWGRFGGAMGALFRATWNRKRSQPQSLQIFSRPPTLFFLPPEPTAFVNFRDPAIRNTSGGYVTRNSIVL
jgi:hypothetical protein